MRLLPPRGVPRVKWIEIPSAALRGEGLRPYHEGEIAILFDWVENMEAGSTHLMPHRGRFIVDIVRIETNTVHQPSKPGDELIVVLNGTLTLTTDTGGPKDVFEKGEMVLIPAGWAGMYGVSADEDDFLELALVPGNYFDPDAAPPPSRAVPRRLELPTAPGRHELFRGRYVLEVENIERAAEGPITSSPEEVIQILTGTLTLSSDGESKSFDPGSAVILPKGFAGDARVTDGYRALIARWLD